MTASTDTSVIIDSARRVAALIAARERGDVEGARALVIDLVNGGDLAGGALLVAELGLGLLSRETGLSTDEVVGRLSLELMALEAR